MQLDRDAIPFLARISDELHRRRRNLDRHHRHRLGSLEAFERFLARIAAQ